ncbi:MAG: GNAT family N-acetyltransferase [Acidobacteriaceae bacterium]
MYSIRDYCPRDFPAMYALDQVCFPPGIAYSRREMRHMIQMRGAVTLLAETQDAAPAGADTEAAGLAGFAIAERAVQRGEIFGHLITIDVKTGLQRTGVGSSLLGALEQRLAMEGAVRMRLEVAEDNAAAQSFYRKSGYAPIGRIAKYYLESIDALLMEKSLAAKSAAV